MTQRFGTRAIHAGQEPDPSTGAITTPIYATSTYVQRSPGKHKGFEYSRSQNPTRFAYERCVADLESGTRGFAFASGVAATATALDLLDSGDHVVAGNDLYGGTFRLFERVRKRSAGLSFTFTDLANADSLRAALTHRTRMVWVETPSNPLLNLVDLSEIARVARDALHGLVLEHLVKVQPEPGPDAERGVPAIRKRCISRKYGILGNDKENIH